MWVLVEEVEVVGGEGCFVEFRFGVEGDLNAGKGGEGVEARGIGPGEGGDEGGVVIEFEGSLEVGFEGEGGGGGGVEFFLGEASPGGSFEDEVRGGVGEVVGAGACGGLGQGCVGASVACGELILVGGGGGEAEFGTYGEP